MRSVDIHSLESRPYQTLHKHELYAHSLRGKRSETRLGKMIGALEHDKYSRNKKILTQTRNDLSGSSEKLSLIQKTNLVQRNIQTINEVFQQIVDMVRHPTE